LEDEKMLKILKNWLRKDKSDKRNILVFDVEALRLNGTGFAVGAVVLDSKGKIIEKFGLMSIQNIGSACEFVQKEVLPCLNDCLNLCATDRELRDSFYKFLIKHKGARIFSDVNYPVETNFLSQICNDDIENREFEMPFPLEDIADASNISIDRMEFYRKNNASYILQDVASRKLIKHNPVDDAIVSAYFLFNHKKGRKHLC
jgi:hypothetical protein